MPLLSASALQDLRTRNPVAGVAERLGAKLRRCGRTLSGSCPMCGGGKTAQRFEVKDEFQWVCAVCQDGGDVIRLVEKGLGVPFREAVAWLGGAEADGDPVVLAAREREIAARKARREAEAEVYREQERERLYDRWTRFAGRERGALARYLAGRGLDARPALLRLDPAAPYMHGEVMDGHGRSGPRILHRGPAMLAPIHRPDGMFGGLHFTWIDPVRPGHKMTIADPATGEVLPAKKVRGSKRAGRIELVREAAPTRLVLGEGIETVLSIAEAEGAPAGTAYWSAVDLGNLGGPAFETVPHPTDTHANGHRRRVPGPQPDWSEPALPIPPSVTELVLLGDGDSDRFLTDCALQRAAARHTAPGRAVRIAMAPDGKDWNDVLRETLALEHVA